MECTVSWTGGSGTRSGMGFVAETGSGHAVLMDGASLRHGVPFWRQPFCCRYFRARQPL